MGSIFIKVETAVRDSRRNNNVDNMVLNWDNKSHILSALSALRLRNLRVSEQLTPTLQRN